MDEEKESAVREQMPKEQEWESTEAGTRSMKMKLGRAYLNTGKSNEEEDSSSKVLSDKTRAAEHLTRSPQGMI